MFLNMRQFFFFLIIAVLFSSCSEYQKILKEEDVKAKYDAAEKFYEDGDYRKAVRLFEQIAPKYVGKPQGERVMFFFADSYFRKGDYYLSGYQFERFIKSYPKSDKITEVAFNSAKSYYMLSPKYSLDQTDTNKALLKIQGFINTYPESEFMEEANEMAQTLTAKKELKAIEIAKQFTRLGESYTLDYNISAIAALNNFVTDFPGSQYREEAMYNSIVASTRLALNSTPNKMKERLLNAKEAYNNLNKYFPETTFQKKADNLLGKIEKGLKQYSK